MKVYYTWFTNPERFDFERMRNVFDYSIKINNPEIEVIEEKVDYPNQIKTLRSVHFENIYKLERWNNVVQNATEKLILIDCDMMCMSDISELDNITNDYDVYFTTRKPEVTNIRCNAGVVVVNPTQEAKEIFQRWYDLSCEFDTDDIHWFRLLQKYKGATQTTLGYMWDNGELEGIVGELPCNKWNATIFEWDNLDEDVKFVHIKSNLRLYILENYIYEKMGKDRDYLLPLQQKWFEYEKEILSQKK